MSLAVTYDFRERIVGRYIWVKDKRQVENGSRSKVQQMEKSKRGLCSLS